MTFHEKSRWIGLVAILMVWTWYFVTIARAVGAGYPDQPYLMALMIPAVIAFTVIHAVGHAVIAVMKPKEANAAMDERERAIAARATIWGYNLLSFGIFLVITGSFFWWNSFVIVNALMFAFVLADSARYVAEIVLYRRASA